MTDRSPLAALHAMLDAINGVAAATADKTFDDFSGDWLLRHGVQRGIEIISEAARRLPPELTITQPHIPWPEIRAIGNVLRHEYHRISDRIVWNVVVTHLPPLHKAICAIISDLPA